MTDDESRPVRDYASELAERWSREMSRSDLELYGPSHAIEGAIREALAKAHNESAQRIILCDLNNCGGCKEASEAILALGAREGG